jgi:hypothetical protein
MECISFNCKYWSSYRPLQTPRTRQIGSGTLGGLFGRRTHPHAEGKELGKLVKAYIRALEATDFAERLTKLERMTHR